MSRSPTVPAADAPAPPATFPAFFDREYPKLRRALYVVTHSVSDADELAQEAMAKVWEHWDRVSRMEDAVGYLYRTALNARFQAHRRAIRAAGRRIGGAPPNDPLAVVEERDQLQRALMELPERQRAALVVTELLGYDSESAGRILGVRAGTVRRMAGQARARLSVSLRTEER